MFRLTPLMLDRLGKTLHIGDAIILLNTFPATVKDFEVHDGELGAVVQRSTGKIGFVFFEEIERSNPTKTIRPGKYCPEQRSTGEQHPVKTICTDISSSSEPVKEVTHEEVYHYQTGCLS